MKKTISLFLATSLLVSANLFAFDLNEINPMKLVFGEGSRCKKLEWVKASGRTQGDGWIWFTGKGIEESAAKAYLKAEGMAVTRMIQECVVPHKEAKIHERCDEKIGGNHYAYARISLKSSKCREAKYSKGEFRKVITNQELQKVYAKYQKELGVSVDVKEARTAKEHHKLGKYYFFLGSLDKAYYHFDSACREGLIKSCYNAGLVMFQRENYTDAKKYLAMSCAANNFSSCYFLGKVHSIQLQHAKASKAFKKACKGQDATGCHAISLSYFQNDQKSLARVYAKKACDYEYGKGCYNYALVSSKKTQERYYKKSCEYGVADGCAKYGAVLYSKGKKNSALKYAEKACHNGNYKACHNAGYLNHIRKRDTRALEFFQIACHNDFTASCGWVEKLDH